MDENSAAGETAFESIHPPDMVRLEQIIPPSPLSSAPNTPISLHQRSPSEASVDNALDSSLTLPATAETGLRGPPKVARTNRIPPSMKSPQFSKLPSAVMNSLTPQKTAPSTPGRQTQSTGKKKTFMKRSGDIPFDEKSQLSMPALSFSSTERTLRKLKGESIRLEPEDEIKLGTVAGDAAAVAVPDDEISPLKMPSASPARTAISDNAPDDEKMSRNILAEMDEMEEKRNIAIEISKSTDSEEMKKRTKAGIPMEITVDTASIEIVASAPPQKVARTTAPSSAISKQQPAARPAQQQPRGPVVITRPTTRAVPTSTVVEPTSELMASEAQDELMISPKNKATKTREIPQVVGDELMMPDQSLVKDELMTTPPRPKVGNATSPVKMPVKPISMPESIETVTHKLDAMDRMLDKKPVSPPRKSPKKNAAESTSKEVGQHVSAEMSFNSMFLDAAYFSAAAGVSFAVASASTLNAGAACVENLVLGAPPKPKTPEEMAAGWKKLKQKAAAREELQYDSSPYAYLTEASFDSEIIMKSKSEDSDEKTEVHDNRLIIDDLMPDRGIDEESRYSVATPATARDFGTPASPTSGGGVTSFWLEKELARRSRQETAKAATGNVSRSGTAQQLLSEAKKRASVKSRSTVSSAFKKEATVFETKTEPPLVAKRQAAVAAKMEPVLVAKKELTATTPTKTESTLVAENEPSSPEPKLSALKKRIAKTEPTLVGKKGTTPTKMELTVVAEKEPTNVATTETEPTVVAKKEPTDVATTETELKVVAKKEAIAVATTETEPKVVAKEAIAVATKTEPPPIAAKYREPTLVELIERPDSPVLADEQPADEKVEPELAQVPRDEQPADEKGEPEFSPVPQDEQPADKKPEPVRPKLRTSGSGRKVPAAVEAIERAVASTSQEPDVIVHQEPKIDQVAQPVAPKTVVAKPEEAQAPSADVVPGSPPDPLKSEEKKRPEALPHAKARGLNSLTEVIDASTEFASDDILPTSAETTEEEKKEEMFGKIFGTDVDADSSFLTAVSSEQDSAEFPQANVTPEEPVVGPKPVEPVAAEKLSGVPYLIKTLDDVNGICKGDLIISLVHAKGEDAKKASNGGTQVRNAAWRMRVMRRRCTLRSLGMLYSEPTEPIAASASSERPGHGSPTKSSRETVAQLKSLEGNALDHLQHDEFDEAVKIYREIWHCYKDRLTEESAVVNVNEYLGNVLHNLGIINILRQDYEAALDNFSEAAKRRKSLGTPNSSHLATIVKAAMCHYALDNFSKAHKALEACLEFAKGHCKTITDFIQIAEMLNNLGCLSFMCGQPGESSKMFNESIGVQQAVLSHALYGGSLIAGHSMSLSVSVTRANMAFLKMCAKDHLGAIHAFEAALTTQQILLMDAHETLIGTMDHLAVANLLSGNKDKALKMLERMLLAQINAYGIDNIRCQNTKSKIAMVKEKETKIHQAIADISKAHSVEESISNARSGADTISKSHSGDSASSPKQPARQQSPPTSPRSPVEQPGRKTKMLQRFSSSLRKKPWEKQENKWASKSLSKRQISFDGSARSGKSNRSDKSNKSDGVLDLSSRSTSFGSRSSDAIARKIEIAAENDLESKMFEV